MFCCVMRSGLAAGAASVELRRGCQAAWRGGGRTASLTPRAPGQGEPTARICGKAALVSMIMGNHGLIHLTLLYLPHSSIQRCPSVY